MDESEVREVVQGAYQPRPTLRAQHAVYGQLEGVVYAVDEDGFVMEHPTGERTRFEWAQALTVEALP